MSAFAIVGARIFDGRDIHAGRAAVIDGGRIAAVVADNDLPVGIDVRKVEGLLAPGFIDTQVNGGGGILFNDVRTPAGIAAIGAAHRPFGTTGFLPTVITDTRERMAEAIGAARDAIAAGVPGVLGVHVEGPFLSPERKGVHDPRHMRPIDDEDIRLLSAPTGGRTLVTLAPERVPLQAIARLAQAGVLVSAGHTAAPFETIRAAREAGLAAFTHVYNAMPPLAGREPGPVGAALDDGEAWAGIIVDLHHVSAASLRVAIAARGYERTMLVTDAMPLVGTDLVSFELLGRTVTRAGGRLTLADGTLAGSDLDMATAVRNAVLALGLPLEAALHMASRAAAEFLGLGGELGRIARGFRADLVLLDDGLNAAETWIGGIASRG